MHVVAGFPIVVHGKKSDGVQGRAADRQKQKPQGIAFARRFDLIELACGILVQDKTRIMNIMFIKSVHL
jgi:hypothetical protein